MLLRGASAALAAMPFAAYVGAIVLAVATESTQPLVFVAVLACSDLLNRALKRGFAAVLPAWLVDRPTGMGALSPPYPGCSQLGCGGPSPKKGMGFPSGHAQSMGVVVGYIAVAAPHRVSAIAASSVIAAAVMAQRVIVGCHSVWQAAAGGVIGLGLGAGGAALFAPPHAK